MPDPTTTNTSLAIPVRGTDAGTWDVPVNGNFTSLDAMMGSVTTVALTNAPVTLTTAQALVNVIRLTGTLSSSVVVTLPGIYKSWTIDNQVVNAPSSFSVTLVSTSGSSKIGLPPGPQDIFYDGTTVNYRNLGRIGDYWDYAGPVVPNWVTNSTKPPYLNCDGTSFSTSAYPQLANILGGGTLPDSRGRFRAALNQTTGRLTSAGGGVDGNTAYAAGSSETTTLNTSNLPAYTPSGSGTAAYGEAVAGQPSGIAAVVWPAISGGLANASVIPVTLTMSAQGGVSNAFSNVPPTYIGGLTLIRAN